MAAEGRGKTSAAPPVEAFVGGPLNIFVEIDPLLEIVRRHVHDISPAAMRAITNEFANAFRGTAPLQVRQARKSPRAVASEVVDLVLSSQEAADLAGVSRPYMVARIDAGDVELHLMAGNQRRVLKSSVLAWQKKEQTGRRRAIAALGASLDEEIFSS